MLRIKDPLASLDFYTRILGFQLIDQRHFPADRFSLYFLAYLPPGTIIPADPELRRQWQANLSGLLELTHNHGTETQESMPYHNGNSTPRGYGHICISVPDIRAACTRFEQLGVAFQKRLDEGRMKNIAFIRDPDDYWIEIISSRFQEEENI